MSIRSKKGTVPNFVELGPLWVSFFVPRSPSSPFETEEPVFSYLFDLFKEELLFRLKSVRLNESKKRNIVFPSSKFSFQENLNM